jgi:pilus assembly protein CpaF
MNEKSFLTALGPLAELYSNPDVQVIMVDAPDRVLVDRRNEEPPMDSGVKFASVEALSATVAAILAAANVKLANGQSVVDTRLADSSRMLAILPPTAVNGPTLTLVKMPVMSMTWEMLIQYGSINQEAMDFLQRAVLARRNVLVAGGYSSGKTTVMNLICEFVPANKRLVVVQTDFDLQVRHPLSVFLAAGEGSGPNLSDLITTASKMRGDWMAIGELIGPEALRAMEIFSRGHGGITTIHANSPEDALTRLETMCLKANLGLGLGEIRSLISSALHIIVHQERLANGRRKIMQIVELRGLENGRYILQPLFRYNPEKDLLEATGAKPGWE